MSIDRFGIYPASFVHAGGTLAFAQLGAATASPGSEIDSITPGGSLDAGAHILRCAKPQCSLRTEDLATILAAISVTAGLVVTGAGTFRYQKRAVAGFAGGSTNVQVAATSGFLFPMSLSSAEESRAMLEIAFAPFFDGTNQPLAATSGVALSGATPAFGTAFFQGPVYLGATQLEGCIQTRVDFGLEFDFTRADGTVWPTTGAVIARRPRFSLTFKKASILPDNVQSMFLGAMGSALSCYFRKGVAGGARVADATAQHCKISAATGAMAPEDLTVEGQDDATFTLGVMPTGTISSSVASAIP